MYFIVFWLLFQFTDCRVMHWLTNWSYMTTRYFQPSPMFVLCSFTFLALSYLSAIAVFGRQTSFLSDEVSSEQWRSQVHHKEKIRPVSNKHGRAGWRACIMTDRRARSLSDHVVPVKVGLPVAGHVRDQTRRLTSDRPVSERPMTNLSSVRLQPIIGHSISLQFRAFSI